MKLNPITIEELINSNCTERLDTNTYNRVYLTYHNNENFVIKTNHQVTDQKMIDITYNSLVNENRILSEIYHPHIIERKSFIEDDQRCYLLLEHLSGMNFYNQMNYLNIFQNLEVVKQISSSLLYLNYRGIIHNDIKPENIIVNNKFYAKLIDFGFAEYEYDLNYDIKEDIFGTTNYISKNKLFNCEYHTSKENTYSLGIILMDIIGYTESLIETDPLYFNPILENYDNKKNHKKRVKEILLDEDYSELNIEIDDIITPKIIDLIGEMTCNEDERIEIHEVTSKIEEIQDLINEEK